ncbi:MAG: response regulator transcription factor [Baekduia sp.]
MQIAVIDSDSGFLQVLANRLGLVGWTHRTLPGGAPVDELRAMRPDALVLDPAALGPGAEEYLRRVCTELPELTVIVCTTGATVAERVRGLRAGADDWLTKPCHPEELIARIEAIERRRLAARAAAAPPARPAGPLVIRPDHFQAYVDGLSTELTRREFALLVVLHAAGGRVLEREEIYRQVWGYAMAHGDRSVDVFVRKLRRKLERACPEWRFLHTHFGVGYRFSPEGPEGDGGAGPVTDALIPRGAVI